MNANAIIAFTLLALGGATATAYVASERKSHSDEVGVYSDQIKVYANYVGTAAQNDPALAGTLTAAQVELPDWITLDPTVSNYVDQGTAYVYFMPATPAFGNEVARSCTVSVVCGLKNAAGRIVQPGSGDDSVPAPASAPVGAMVMRLGAGAQTCVVPDRATTAEGEQESESRATCAAGSAGTQLWGRSRQRTAQASCPDPNGSLVWSYSGWYFTDWEVQSSSCTSCPASTSQSQTRWVNGSSTCPSGQVGSITFEQEERQSRTVSYNCPAGTLTVPGPTYGGWGSWTATGATRNVSSTCTAACTAPGSTSTAVTRAATPATRDAGCPAGQSGQHLQSMTRVENGTQTTSYSCPSSTGSPVASTSTTWLGTYTNTGSWTTTSNTCSSTCTAPAPTTTGITRSVSAETRTVACPSGQTGTHAQSRTRTENGTRYTSWTCPGPTSSVSDGWLGTYNYGSWTTTSNTCAPPTATCTAPGSTSAAVTRAATPATRDAGCPSGQSGQHLQSMTRVENGTQTTSYSCPSSTGSPVASTSTTWLGTYTNTGSWTTTSNTCVASCDPTQTTKYWESTAVDVGCPAGQSGQHLVRREVVHQMSCPSGNWGPGSYTGATQEVSNTCKASTAAIITSESFSGYSFPTGCPIYSTHLPAHISPGVVAGNAPVLTSVTVTRTRQHLGGSSYGPWSSWSISSGGSIQLCGSVPAPRYPNTIPVVYAIRTRTVTAACPSGSGTMSWTQTYMDANSPYSLGTYDLVFTGAPYGNPGGISNITYNCTQ